MKNRRLIVILLGALILISAVATWAAEQPAPRTISDITALLDQYKPDPRLAEQNRAKVRAEPPAGMAGRDLAKFLRDRAWAAQAIGDHRRQIADLRKAIEILGNDGGEMSVVYQSNLAVALRDAGNYVEAVRIREAILRRGALAGRVILTTGFVTRYYAGIGDRESAQPALRQGENAYSQYSSGRNQDRAHYFAMFLFGMRAAVLALENKFDQAEVAFRRAVQEAQFDQRFLLGHRLSDQADGRTAASMAENAAYQHGLAELDLAAFLMDRNRLEEAELLARNVLRRILTRLGRDNARTSIVMEQFAQILRAQGRYHEAMRMAQAAVESDEKAGAVPEASGLAASRRTLGSALALQGRWAEASKVFEEMRAGLATDPETLRVFGRGDPYWGLALIKAGRFQEAVALLAPRVEQDRKVLGESHPELALNRGVLGMALAHTGEKQRALAEFNAAAAALLDSGVLAGERSAAQTQLLRHVLEGYIELLMDIRGTNLEQGQHADALSLAFRLADVMRGQSVQGALSASAARAAAGEPAVAALVRKEQDLNEQARALYGYLFNQLSLRPEDQSQKIIADMRKRLDEIAVERKQLQADLQRRFPRYAEFVNPRPVTLEQARAVLREGEVLVSVLTTQERTYVWALPKSGAVGFHSASLGEKEIERIVAGLRRSLDPGEVTIGRMLEFDVAQAAMLYEALLKPVESAWKGAHTLMVVANGALAQLPFSVLPTAPTALAAEQGPRFERYKQVPWLIKEAGIVQLPAVNTLVTLRALPQGNAQRTAFAGFGDPQFGAQQVAVAGDANTTVTRNLGIQRVTEAGLREGSAPANYIAYSALPPLPDTREEILAIANALKADTSKDVFLGLQASKQNVKSANLATRRIVAFATHGLIPGDFPNLDEPALALSSPDGTAESGLLTLGDILALKMDADWVVLSACNTAAGDGAGAEAISGLGRGFFYAGSRALLVTHWPVESRSARQLVTTLFERYAGNPALSRAEALRQASLAVMEDSAKDASGKALYSYAHPIFWAPYALVGDGGR